VKFHCDYLVLEDTIEVNCDECVIQIKFRINLFVGQITGIVLVIHEHLTPMQYMQFRTTSN
jgi:hypothetical protein